MDPQKASVEPLPDGVFISYQRSSGAYVARAIYQSLTQQQYDVFLDVEKVDSGRFENVILNQLGRRPHFIVVLTPGTVTAIESASDWVAAGDRNGLTLVPEYFDAAMEALTTRFLKQPTLQELRFRTAEEHDAASVRARENDDHAFAEHELNDAIDLDPGRPDYFQNRAVARLALGALMVRCSTSTRHSVWTRPASSLPSTVPTFSGPWADSRRPSTPTGRGPDQRSLPERSRWVARLEASTSCRVLRPILGRAATYRGVVTDQSHADNREGAREFFSTRARLAVVEVAPAVAETGSGSTTGSSR